MPAKKQPAIDPVECSQRFLVRSEEPKCLDEFINMIEDDSGALLLDEIGPLDKPHTLVVAMGQEYAAALKQRFAGRIIIEPDRPLSNFSDSSQAVGKKSNANPALAGEAEAPYREDQIEMADKNEQTTAQPGSGRSGATASTGAATRTAPSGISTPPGKVLGARQKQFIIAPRRAGGMMQPAHPAIGFQPVALDYVEQALRASPDVEVVDRIGPTGLIGTLADGMGGMPHVLVAKMANDKAEILKQQSLGQLIVERDQPLHLDLSEASEPGLVAAAVATGGPVASIAVMVLGRDNAPIKDAEVYLFGGLLPASGVTDERGLATLSVLVDDTQSVTGFYVKPKSDYWTFYQSQPALETNQTNLVYLRSLSDSFPGFPRQQALGWGQKAMRLDQLPGNYRGQGVRVAIVDSGAATTHPSLQGIRFGLDLTNKKADAGTWNRDTISHGSHCAGIIAGADNGAGIRGFVPDAEIHICKQFPGGQVSQLIEVLEYCIEKQIDLVNLSLGGVEFSETLEQQILRAKRLGVACIAAAGNSGGPVQYPASSPNVLAVAAAGKIGEFPPDSYHAQTAGPTNATGFFSPRFTCFGPEISLCAPGVAILSSVPPSNFAAWDGTSMAASHVTGLAGLVLAHHPDFQGPFRARNADRVARLFQILRASAQPLILGDPRRTGFGMPDVLIALGLAPQTQRIPSLFANQFGNAAPFGMNPAAALYSLYPELAQLGWPGLGQPASVVPNASAYLHAPVGTW
jgi:subtilisin